MDTARFEHDRLALFARNGFLAESRWLEDASGRKTYALVREGKGRAPATLVIHGGLADATVWHAMAGHLPDDGKVVIPDRPGHGLSYAMDYAGVDYRKDAVAWMLHLVDALGERQVDLVGNSMGGYFCFVFALAYPERVRRIVTTGAPAGVDRELPLFLRLWGLPLIGNLISKMMASMKEPESLRTKVLAPMVARPERIASDAIEVMFQAGSRSDWHPMARGMVRAVSDIGGWRPDLNIREEVARLAIPTCFLWGDKDNFAPPSSGQDLARRMPKASIEVLDNAGHLPQLDVPEELGRGITDFFRADRTTSIVNGRDQSPTQAHA